MSATKVLWGQIVVVFAIVLVTMWAATQWVAWELGYQPQLGQPWFELTSGVLIYFPPAFFWWWYAYDAYAPQVLVEGAYIALSGGFISIAVAAAMSVWRAREAKTAATYGSARWATHQEIRAAGLTEPDGVVLGKFERNYLRHDGPEHVLCFAPTRSGKGVGLVVPTLLTWPGCCIVHDIKGENWTLTSGFRSRHGRVLLFDPTNSKSAAYNPLLEVRRGEWKVRDVQNVADVLVDSEGSLERRNHWVKTSHALLVGVILHVFYAEPDKTLAGVASFLSDPKWPIEATLRAMMTTVHLGEAGPHPVIASAPRELLSKSENERLTPGEVMQLPPGDELILVSGVPPIRAKKARYFEDPRLTERVLAPPSLHEQNGAVPPMIGFNRQLLPSALALRPIRRAKKPPDDPANGGIRREPELPQHEEIGRETVKLKPEFAFGEDEPDDHAERARALRQQVRNLARMGSMDPGDGMGL
jgi:type IV secretory pathway TraG/TraD family ATPase VirD4